MPATHHRSMFPYVTPWFTHDRPPVRAGMYQCRHRDTGEASFCYYSPSFMRWVYLHEDMEEAAAIVRSVNVLRDMTRIPILSERTQVAHWRGLTMPAEELPCKY